MIIFIENATRIFSYNLSQWHSSSIATILSTSNKLIGQLASAVRHGCSCVNGGRKM